MRISAQLLVVTIALLFVMTTAVAFADNPHVITWLSGTEPIEVNAGETVEFTATFMTSQALEDVTAYVTLGLHSAIEAPVVYLNELEPDQIYTIRYTIHVPHNVKKGTYSGVILIGEDSQLRPGVRTLVDLLPMKIRVN